MMAAGHAVKGAHPDIIVDMILRRYSGYTRRDVLEEDWGFIQNVLVIAAAEHGEQKARDEMAKARARG